MVLHIVFGQSSAAALRAAFELDPLLESEVLVFEDDLSVGPLFILDTPDGRAARKQWWNQVLDVPVPVIDPEAPPVEVVPEPDPLKELKGRLREEEELELWIWAGQNATDVSGYYWLISQLERFSGRVQLLYLNNLPFLNEKGGVFYPTHLSQILAKEFLKAKKLVRVVSTAEFELDGDEWRRLMNENAGIRLLEGGKKLRGEAADFYDKDLLAQVTKDFQKASKVISAVTGKFKYPVMDQFLCWRLKELIKQDKVQARGELKTMKEFEVKVPSGELEFEETTNPAENG